MFRHLSDLHVLAGAINFQSKHDGASHPPVSSLPSIFTAVVQVFKRTKIVLASDPAWPVLRK